MGKEPPHVEDLGTEAGGKGAPKGGGDGGHKARARHNKSDPEESLLRRVGTDFVDKKRHEDDDEIEGERHPELRERNEEDIPIIPFAHGNLGQLKQASSGMDRSEGGRDQKKTKAISCLSRKGLRVSFSQ